MTLLRVEHLAKSYKKRQVIADVSLHVSSGQIVGLLGPNGAGKTTCFYMIVGLVRQDQGRIFIDDHEVTHLPMHGRARQGIGYLPQEASVFRKLSVEDNILAILQTRKDLSAAQRQERLETYPAYPQIPGHEPVRRRAAAGGNRPGTGHRARLYPSR